MINGKTVLAIIPARGGSKGVPRKNIRVLHGKPLITWTIEAAQGSGYIDEIIVSTDDRQITEISEGYGAKIPFMRPAELATDGANSAGLILHALDWMKKNSTDYDVIVLLQPTSPFRLTEDIDQALELLAGQGPQAIISVCEVDHSPHWSNILPPNGCMRDFIRPQHCTNRQDMPTFYRINGCVYAAYADYFRGKNGFHGEQTFAYVMPRERSLDIDAELDFRIAEALFEELMKCQTM
jgi:N-acylneuraminate cytidylyltransferase/CMP-N,N'-diacetyllegionaminic acid synthase